MEGRFCQAAEQKANSATHQWLAPHGQTYQNSAHIRYTLRAAAYPTCRTVCTDIGCCESLEAGSPEMGESSMISFEPSPPPSLSAQSAATATSPEQNAPTLTHLSTSPGISMLTQALGTASCVHGGTHSHMHCSDVVWDSEAAVSASENILEDSCCGVCMCDMSSSDSEGESEDVPCEDEEVLQLEDLSTAIVKLPGKCKNGCKSSRRFPSCANGRVDYADEGCLHRACAPLPVKRTMVIVFEEYPVFDYSRSSRSCDVACESNKCKDRASSNLAITSTFTNPGKMPPIKRRLFDTGSCSGCGKVVPCVMEERDVHVLTLKPPDDDESFGLVAGGTLVLDAGMCVDIQGCLTFEDVCFRGNHETPATIYVRGACNFIRCTMHGCTIVATGGVAASFHRCHFLRTSAALVATGKHTIVSLSSCVVHACAAAFRAADGAEVLAHACATDGCGSSSCRCTERTNSGSHNVSVDANDSINVHGMHARRNMRRQSCLGNCSGSPVVSVTSSKRSLELRRTAG